jgi:glutathione synthase/RimK-type ligase-like ATP-grasp enzyme
MLAIHNSPTGFHPRWIDYCEREGIPYRLVNCHATDIIEQVQGCQALMWHHGQSSPKDVLIARPILSALEHAGVKVFPDFRTAWHFDDKLAQKYLFEALDIPAVPAHAFVDRVEALAWVEEAKFPKVFKLRRGAGSAGVRLVYNRPEARRLIRRAFGRGFPIYNPWGSLKERLYKVRTGKLPAIEIAKGLLRIFHPPYYSHILGRERGYVYFQDYLPNNDCDNRVIVIGNRAFGIRRFIRPGDFRASGSGLIAYERKDIDERCVKLAFEAAEKIGSECAAFDFVFDEDRNPWILEVSYGFIKEVYDPCVGYWNRDLSWKNDKFTPQGWMVDTILESKSQCKIDPMSNATPPDPPNTVYRRN